MPRILIIDDEPEIRSLLDRMLVPEGFDVVSAAEGRAGLTLFQQSAFDLVITDIIMPEQEGIETIIGLKRHDRSVPIVAISGGGRVSPEDYLQTAEDLGVAATLRKPFSRADLLETVRRVLGDA
ncbi:MAG: response regulator [Planctomycetota bacterium]